MTSSSIGHTNGIQKGGYISYRGDTIISTTTAHLVRLLKFSRGWDENLSDQRTLVRTKPNVDYLCSQLVWVLVVSIADYCRMGNELDAVIRQLEEIESIIQVGSSPQSHWLSSTEWDQIRDWFSRMVGRILGPFRSNSLWSYDYGDMEDSFDTVYVPSTKR